ncbi:type II secretion system F family protein [uncultured Dubosiella sp.]|uniref:type II secretion system F family protein n=2 Tax=uncultured Dubosiella sp. TaxID=1937011 RepID=UPI0025B4160C|nr:type II secretion system F family protein [uncultured Dubosiella sp.]
MNEPLPAIRSKTSRRASTYSISKDEIDMFVTLGAHGTPIKKRVRLSFRAADALLERLDRGEDLLEILCQGDEPYFSILRLLAPSLSLANAHRVAIEYDGHAQKAFRSFGRRCAYSIFVFLFSFAMIYFFSQLIYPQMAAYAQDFGTALSLLKFFMNVLLAGLAGFFAFLGYVFLLPAQEWIERRLRTRSWMKKWVSLQMATLLRPLMKARLSTKDAFYVLARLENDSRIAYYARQIVDRLESGQTLLEAMDALDPDLLTFVELGMESMDMEAMLGLYLRRSEKRMKKLEDDGVRLLQLLSYSCVGILVFVAYEILLSPLNVLYTI